MTHLGHAPRTSQRTVFFALLGGFLLATLVFCVIGYAVNGGSEQTAPAAPAAPVSAASTTWTAAEQDYLSALRSSAPGMSMTDDALLVEMGRLGCTVAGQNGGSWVEPVSIVTREYGASDAGVWVFQAQRYLCP